jgi:solute carrier family 36 (proton-coupled amino acid transporter)
MSGRRDSVGGISARRPVGLGLGAGSSQNVVTGDGEAPPPDIADLPDEEKAKVLRRHLVSQEERDVDDSAPSRQSSSSQLRLRQEHTEAFPVPYHAPGADVT